MICHNTHHSSHNQPVSLSLVNREWKRTVLKGFKNFLMRGDLITIAVGLVIALAFSTLIKAFTDYVINP
ncbi:putative membrane protein [Streptomyces davaonensis JCM 4913]|uniref:Putative membrane protein n=1 Tax=Streptomyces davaonensis (strain DSM 101723 / JCM 4913 / KCC S-0913 / 768) TaxID=1214101 RepID=K4QXN1_STRDJ|nr:putative membrane protein [Streptomyces davaonensis JCM 4913]